MVNAEDIKPPGVYRLIKPECEDNFKSVAPVFKNPNYVETNEKIFEIELDDEFMVLELNKSRFGLISVNVLVLGKEIIGWLFINSINGPDISSLEKVL